MTPRLVDAFFPNSEAMAMIGIGNFSDDFKRDAGAQITERGAIGWWRSRSVWAKTDSDAFWSLLDDPDESNKICIFLGFGLRCA